MMNSQAFSLGTILLALVSLSSCSSSPGGHTSAGGGGSGGLGGAGGAASATSSSTGGSGGMGGGSNGTGGSLPEIVCTPDFSVTIESTAEQTLFEGKGNAYGGTTATASNVDPLISNKLGTMHRSACGDIGMVYDKGDSTKCELVYARFGPNGVEEESVVAPVDSSYCQPFPAFFYDDECAPHVLLRNYTTGLTQYDVNAQGQWTEKDVDLSLPAGLSVRLIRSAFRGLDGKVHAILQEGSSSFDYDTRLVHGVYDGAGKWTTTVLPALQYTVGTGASSYSYNEFFNFAVDKQGKLHVVFNDDKRLAYAVESSGQWQQQILVPTVGSRDITGFDAFIAIDPATDRPAIVASSSTHHSGWSIKTLKLYYHSQNADGTWTSELLAEKADGYVGGDGNNYTGFQTQLHFDAYGQPNVTFSDLASWHITYNYRAPGQIRRAIKACDKWHVQTIFQQPGQVASPNPIHECRHPMMLPYDDANMLLFACMERVIDDPKGAMAGPTPSLTARLRTFRVTQSLK